MLNSGMYRKKKTNTTNQQNYYTLLLVMMNKALFNWQNFFITNFKEKFWADS